MKYLLLFISLTFLISDESMAQQYPVNLMDVYWGEELLDRTEYDISLESEGISLWPIFVDGGYYFVSPGSSRKINVVVNYKGQSISLQNVDISYILYYSHISISINPLAGDSCVNLYSIVGDLIEQIGGSESCLAFHNINLIARQNSFYGGCNLQLSPIRQWWEVFLKGGLPAEFEDYDIHQ